MFLSLISGSSGNASIISDNTTLILTDCGMSGKKLEEAFSSLGLSCADISAILITHEHIDHTRGAGIISRRYNIPVYATKGTFDCAQLGNIPEGNIHYISPGIDFEIGDIGIRPFSISHDANDPVGYNYFLKNKKFTVATDMGEITQTAEESIIGSDEILLEANHDVDMLMYGTYPFALKQRILSNIGHLSNDSAADACVRLLKSGTKKIMLGHLSNENNTPPIAYEACKSALLKSGAKLGDDIELSVADRYKITRF